MFTDSNGVQWRTFQDVEQKRPWVTFQMEGAMRRLGGGSEDAEGGDGPPPPKGPDQRTAEEIERDALAPKYPFAPGKAARKSALSRVLICSWPWTNASDAVEASVVV